MSAAGTTAPTDRQAGSARLGFSVWALFTCQALLNLVVFAQVAMSALIGHALAGDKALATVPFALQMLATMMASIPAGIVFTRLGRRPGFLLGCAGSLLGSIVYGLGVWQGSFVLYCCGAPPAGLGYGIAQHLRFAAAEAASDRARPKAIALVLSGGIVAALIGPEVLHATEYRVPGALFLGTYATLAVMPLIAAALLCFARLAPAARHLATATPIRIIIARRDFVVAVIAGMTGFGAMNFVMTSTPVQMMLCGFGVDQSTDVIRMHSLAMYAPGFVTGRLIQRFGAHRVITVGGALSVGCALMSFAAPTEIDFMAALVLLGIGWNFMFTGATTLLSRAHDQAERVRAQATNDFIVFGMVALTAFMSGVVHVTAGWIVLNLVIVPPVIVAVALVLWHEASRRRVALAA